MISRRLQVYISSTFEDLAAEREAVAAAIRSLDHVACTTGGAQTAPTKANCERDVRACDVYVVLVGHRYGSVGDPATGRSFTELEFDAAQAAGLPTLAYVAADRPGGAAPPAGGADPLTRFRAKVRAGARFQSAVLPEPARLQAAVCADLHRAEVELERSRGGAPSAPLPELLPYLCDRSPQRTALRRALKAAARDGAWRPVVAIAHGSERQAVDRLLDCVRAKDLPAVLEGRNARPEPIDVVLAPGDPHASDVAADLAASLADGPAWLRDVVTPDDVSAALRRAPGPVIVRHQVSHDYWGPAQRRRLDAFVALFTAPGIGTPHPVLAVAWAQYREPRGGFLSFARRRALRTNDAMRAAIATFDGRALVLDELADVRPDDVTDWLGRDWPARVRRPASDAVHALFAGKDGLPMEHVGEGLRRLLEDSATATEGIVR